MTFRPVVLLLGSLFLVGCSGDSGGNPAGPTPPTANASLSGTVFAQGGARIPGATVTIIDGANAGRSVLTNSIGGYTLANLTPGNGNVQATAPDFEPVTVGIVFDQSIIRSFTLRTIVPFTRSGFGNDVFDLPTFITRVRIQGTFTGSSSNFIVRIAGSLVVNELLGTFWGPLTYNGVHLTNGGTVAITNSSEVAWTFTEVR